jgi:hypothetical protein
VHPGALDLQAVPPADQDREPEQPLHGDGAQWQEFFYGNRYAESYMDALPDFVKLAEAYGTSG